MAGPLKSSSRITGLRRVLLLRAGKSFTLRHQRPVNEDRCQVDAIGEKNGVMVVDIAKCIGCGLCVTKCPSGAATLERKSDNALVLPPADYRTWENERLRSRSLIE
ncbi:MAG: 4Fe-4S binding protein [Candidatus Thermoplasmatota archaeon]|nr:4Fe-4S binding protein [Candidatus Thermoplasmatota archaeon]